MSPQTNRWRSIAVGSAALLGLVCVVGIWGVSRLGGWRYTLHRLYTNDAWPTFTQRMSQLERLPINPGGVIVLGDSHAAYGEWTELLGLPEVYNRGIPGAGVQQVHAFAKTLELSAARAIVVQVGTNDLLFHTVDSVSKMYDRLLIELLALTEASDSFKIVLVTLPGVNNEVRWTGISELHISQLNNHIRLLVGREALRHPTVELVDLAHLLGTDEGVLPAEHTDDGVHLRGAAYQLWGKALTEVIGPGMTFAH